MYALATKSTVAETGDKSATKSTVADTVDKSATTWIRQLVAVDIVANSVDFVADRVDFVADTVDFVASVNGAKTTRLTSFTFNKVDRVEFNFVASVYRA